MNKEKSGQLEAAKLIAKIEQHIGANVRCLENSEEILSKINKHVHDKDEKIKSIEENKKNIVSKILREKLCVKKNHKKPGKLNSLTKKQKKKSVSTIASDTNTQGEPEELSQESQSTGALLPAAAAEGKGGRTSSNKLRRRKSKKTLQSKSDLVIDTKISEGNIPSESCAARKARPYSQKNEKRDIMSYHVIKEGLESSYCLRDWQDIFCTKPETLIFYDFINGNTYKRLIKLTNKTAKIISCRFHSIFFPDCLHMDSETMSVVMLNEVKLYPGLFFNFNLTFMPKSLENDFKVELIFVANISNHMTFIPVPVQGILTDSVVEVNPLTIDFGLKPVWTICDKTKKYRKEITVLCSGRRPIELFVKNSESNSRSQRPNKPSGKSQASASMQVAQSSQRSENDLCNAEAESTLDLEVSKTSLSVTTILEDCIQLATDAFYFENRHVTLKPNVPNKIYVWFKNAKYLGFHQAQFNLEFSKYSNKATDKTSLTLFNKKKLTLFSETYDLPLVITPTTLDLTTARLKHGSIYSSFSIYNEHKNLSACVEIVEPKLENHFLKITPEKLFIQPLKVQKFKIIYSVKHTSEENIILNDSVVNISVTLHARIKNEKYSHAPPLNIQIYAPCNL